MDTGASIFHNGAYDRENPIRRCLDEMLYSCEQEEEAALQRGLADEQSESDCPLPDFGPVMLFVLEHHILEQVCTAGKSDLPLGMKALALRTLSRAATHTRHPLLLHPTTRNSIAELVAVSSPILPPVFYSTDPTNVIASMGASPTAPVTSLSAAGARSSPVPSTAPSDASTAAPSRAQHPARVARRARLAIAVQEHLLSLLSAVWGHATAEPALVASLEHAASGLAQYRKTAVSASGKVSASNAPISLWLRGVLGLLPSPQADVSQAAADILLSVLMVREPTVVQWLRSAQHVTAACIAGAVAEAWDAVARQPLALGSLPSTQWASVQQQPAVRRLLSALRCAVVCVDLCAERHPGLAACVAAVLQEHVVSQRLLAAASAPATQEQRASQCVLLQLVLAELAACSVSSPLRLGTNGAGSAAQAGASLLRGLLVGQPLVNLVEAARQGPAYLMTAGCFLLADICSLAPQLLPEAVTADSTCLPSEFEQHPLPDAAKLVNDTLSSSQTRLWELTRQSSGGSGVAAGPDHSEVRAALEHLLAVEADAEAPPSLQLSPPSTPGGQGGTPMDAPVTPSTLPPATSGASAAIPPRSVVVAAFKVHVAIASATANWCDPKRTVDTNLALSALLSAALQWQPTRVLLLGSKKRPQQDAAAAPAPLSCSLATALRHAWNKALQGAAEHTRSMGRTPFQAALLTRKLQLGLPGASCDEGEESEVAVLAAAAAAGSPDPAVKRVLDGATAQLDKLIILDEVSSECQLSMRGLLAELAGPPESPPHETFV